MDFVDKYRIGNFQTFEWTSTQSLSRIRKKDYTNFFTFEFLDDDIVYRTDSDVPFEWTIEMDSQVVTWATQQPMDWQFGGMSEVYGFGSGRHSQLADCGITLNDYNRDAGTLFS